MQKAHGEWDRATVIGFGGGLMVLLLFFFAGGGSLRIILNFPAILFIVVGSFLVTLTGFSFADCLSLRDAIQDVFRLPQDRERELADLFVHCAKLARRGGTLALDRFCSTAHDPLIVGGLKLVVDRANRRALKEFVEEAGAKRLARYQTGIRFFQKMGGFSPTLGIIGTILGLMTALSGARELSLVGGAVAQAFAATMWGVAFANFVCFPLANKLEARRRHVERELELILEGLFSVRDGTAQVAARDRLELYSAGSAR